MIVQKKDEQDQVEREMTSNVALSAQQRRYQSSPSSIKTYKEFLVGAEHGWTHFALFELYNLFISGCPSLLGYGLRRVFIPHFIAHGGQKATIGKGVSIRQPRKISLGKNVIIEDFATLDTRGILNPDAGITLNDYVFIGRYTIIAAKEGSITIEEGVNISSSCRIATQSRVSIGKGTLIGAYCYIGPGNHLTHDLSRPIIEQGMEIKGGVVIGENSWLGARVTVLDGVTIGKNAVIGAHSFVKDNVPDNAVVAGTPAKIIRMR